MKTKTLQIGLVVATVLLGSLESATAQGNLVYNGTFNNNSTGWTPVNISGGGYISSGGDPGGYYYIAGSGESASSISQTFKVTAGQSYLVSIDYFMGQGTSADYGFGVSTAGISYTLQGSSAWQSFSFVFTADSPAALLTFSAGLNNTSACYGVDNISVTAVPEPSPLCLVGLGGIAGLLFLRRKAAPVRL